MKVCIFRNDKVFTDVTSSTGLDETSGWWNCIHVAMLTGWFGFNRKFGLIVLKASTKEPVEMYLNDFDNNGSLDQLICSFQNVSVTPVASLMRWTIR